ncbi:MAG: hypothetical protein ACXWWV_02520 [Candidatus Deferrimicrobiaceae bacterium]
MRKYWSLFLSLLLAASIGLAACQKPAEPPPPPPPPPPAAAPTDNAMKPLVPAEAPKPMEAPKK